MNRIITVLFLILLIACSGSETYRGYWKATDASGMPFEITFKSNCFNVLSNEEDLDFKYTQNSINIENSVETYGITLEDGTQYNIKFPNSKDESKGVILDANGKIVYVLCKDKYIRYEEVFD